MASKNQVTSKKLSKYLIEEDISIIEALKKINENASGLLLVQRDGCLVATLTDGDVRRFILSNGDLKASVREAANYTPKTLPLSLRDEADSFLVKNVIDGVPIIDDFNHVIDIVLMRDSPENNDSKFKLNVPVVMMAGGKGTRLYPYTRILPKPLIPIGEIPIAEHIINGFNEVGCQDFYLIVNYKRNMLKAYFNELDKAYNVHFIDEDKPLGTGGGLSLLKGKMSETFFCTNCDILIRESFEQIYQFHKENGNLITMICSLKNFQIPYGVVQINNEGMVASMIEKPQVPFLTNTGCYVVEPEVVNQIPDNIPMGFPDIIHTCQNNGGKVGVFPIGEDAWFDMGVPNEMERMCKKIKQSGNMSTP